MLTFKALVVGDRLKNVDDHEKSQENIAEALFDFNKITWFIMHDWKAISSGGGSSAPLFLRMCQKNAVLKAFSLAHVPHAMVTTCFKPGGEAANKALRMSSGNSFDGKVPRAGRFTNVTFKEIAELMIHQNLKYTSRTAC